MFDSLPKDAWITLCKYAHTYMLSKQEMIVNAQAFVLMTTPIQEPSKESRMKFPFPFQVFR